MQAELEAAKREQGDQSGSDSEDGGGSDGSSSFGLMERAKGVEPAPSLGHSSGRDRSPERSPRVSPREKLRENQNTGKGQGEGKGRRRKKSTDGGAPDVSEPKGVRQKALLEAGENAVKTLEQITPAALWKNAFKDSEVTSRTKRATSALTDLEFAALTAPVSVVEKMNTCIERLTHLLKNIPPLADMLKKLRTTKKITEVLHDPQVVKELPDILAMLDNEMFGTVLLSIGQKTAEARPNEYSQAEWSVTYLESGVTSVGLGRLPLMVHGVIPCRPA